MIVKEAIERWLVSYLILLRNEKNVHFIYLIWRECRLIRLGLCYYWCVDQSRKAYKITFWNGCTLWTGRKSKNENKWWCKILILIFQVCRNRLGGSPTSSISSSGSLTVNDGVSAADNHYKAVVRALVAETLELSTFLEKVTQGTNFIRAPNAYRGHSGGGERGSNSDADNAGLDGLHFSDWVSLLTLLASIKITRGEKMIDICVYSSN